MSANASDAYMAPHESAKPSEVLPEGYLRAHDDIFSAMITAENQHSCVQDVVDLKPEQNNEFEIAADPTNNQLISCSRLWTDPTSTHTSNSISQAFTFPGLQAQEYSYKSANSSRCDKLVDPWNTLQSHEMHCSVNNSLGCSITVPSLFS